MPADALELYESQMREQLGKRPFWAAVRYWMALQAGRRECMESAGKIDLIPRAKTTPAKACIRHDVPCSDCGIPAWREELGPKGRFWMAGRYLCEPCYGRRIKPWIGLVSPDGRTELNARFYLGEKIAESLTHGAIVPEEIGDGKVRKWRVVRWA